MAHATNVVGTNAGESAPNADAKSLAISRSRGITSINMDSKAPGYVEPPKVTASWPMIYFPLGGQGLARMMDIMKSGDETLSMDKLLW